MRGLVVRVAHVALSLPGRWRDRLYCRRLRDSGDIAETAEVAPTAKIFNSLGREAVTIGASSLFHGEIIVIAPSGQVNIGEFSFIGPGAKLWSMDSIKIGNRVQVSHGVQIFDNNSHSMSASERGMRFHELRTQGRHLQRENVSHKPVKIEDDAWIGFNAAIMKGVTVGRGAIVAAGAIVTHDVPDFEVVAGNPARKIGESRP